MAVWGQNTDYVFFVMSGGRHGVKPPLTHSPMGGGGSCSDPGGCLTYFKVTGGGGYLAYFKAMFIF